MKLFTAVIAMFVLALVFGGRPAGAATIKKDAGMYAGDNKPGMLAKDEVKEGKKKPKKSKKNPNDGKDEDPDDGDAGGGNDDKTKPNDGPAED